MSKKITVLYPVLHYPPVIGGLEQWEQNIAERQHDNVRVVVVTGRVRGAPNFEEKENVLIFRSSPFKLEDLSYSSRLYILTTIPWIFFYSRSIIGKMHVDLVHCHGFVSALFGRLLSFVSGRPFIGTEQSLGWAGGLTKFLRGMVYKRARLCIASSSAVAEEFRKSGVKNIEIIPNGVNMQEFRKLTGPSSDNLADRGSWNILSVGRLEKVKGHKYLLDAFADITAVLAGSDPANSGVRPRLIFVGDGSERKNLESRAKELGVKEYVEFVGAVPHDKLPEYFSRADVFVMPSLSEGFGITAIEAMAAGVPVVASRAGSLLDIIENGKTGILVEPKNPDVIRDAIINLKNNHEYRNSLVRNAETGLAKYNWENISGRVSEIYKNYAGQ